MSPDKYFLICSYMLAFTCAAWMLALNCGGRMGMVLAGTWGRLAAAAAWSGLVTTIILIVVVVLSGAFGLGDMAALAPAMMP